MSDTRRSRTVLTFVLVLLLLTATGVAVDRLRPGDPFAVDRITTDFTYAYEAAPARTVAAAPKRKAPVTAPAKPVGTSCPAIPKVPADAATAARATADRIPVYDKPGGKVVRTLTNPTDEGQPLHALVHGQTGSHLRIQLVARPNGATGWVRATDFARYSVPHHIVVQRCAKKLTVFRSGYPIWSRTVAVGKPSTPTPTGRFFVDFITQMKCCAYGPLMLSVAGFSDVLFQFGKGGTGQIAIHGTNADWSVGKAASNGCVRMHNADVVALSRIVFAGTPVTIVD